MEDTHMVLVQKDHHFKEDEQQGKEQHHQHSFMTTMLWSVTGMNVIAGTVSGAAGVISGHPFDTVKVRLQSQAQGELLKYRSTLHCFVSITKQEGLKGFFKGVSSPLVGVTAINTLLFGVYGFFLESQLPRKGAEPTLNQIFIAGAGSGFVNSFISGPVELAKIQMQNQIEPGKGFKSPMECLKKVYSHSGIRGIYKGLTPTILRETPSYGVYFSFFEWLQRKWTTKENGGNLDNGRLMLAGGLSGIAAWMSTYPIDVIKTRIQAETLFPSDPLTERKTGMYACFKEIIRKEGVPGLFRGTTATIVRAFPTNAVIFSTYALTMRWLDSVNPLRDDE